MGWDSPAVHDGGRREEQLKRRVILLLVSFAVLVGLYIAYRSSTDKIPFFRPGVGGGTAGDELHRVPPGVTEAPMGKGLERIDRDDQGRLRAIYRFEQWDKETANTYRLVKPCIQYFSREGRSVYVLADAGWVYAEEADEKINLRRGNLTKNVRIIFDTGGPMDQSPAENTGQLMRMLDANADQLIRIYTDEVHFDNDQLTIQTDAPVTVFSPQVDIHGTGLLIRWNEEPRELRYLRIEDGRYMCVKQLPTDVRSTGASRGPSRPGATSRPKTIEPSPRSSARNVPDRSPTSRPAATGPAEPPVTKTREKPKPRNIYHAKFLGKHKLVHVDFADSHIHRAEELGLTFDWDPEWQPWDEEQEQTPRAAVKPSPTPKKKKEAAAAARTEKAPVARTAKGLARPSPTERLATLPVKTTEEKQAPDEPMIITWSGPLTIEPVGYTDNPSRDRFEVTARGEDLTLLDSDSTAICRELVFHHPQQTATLRGTKDDPVEMRFDDENTATCQTLRFEMAETQTERIAYLDGSGKMSGMIDGGASRETTSQPRGSDERKPGQIAWSKGAVIHLVEDTSARSEQGGLGRFHVREADFDGDVELIRADSGEYLNSDELHVEVQRTESGKYQPSRAIATGRVRAKQKDGDIRADKVTIEFDDKGDPVTMTADGNVDAVFTDIDEGEFSVHARAARIVSDLTHQTHDLYASGTTFATIARGKEILSADETIFLDEKNECGKVEGKGELQFETTESLSGKLTEPLIALVTWTEGMRFDDRGGTIDFDGGVTFDVGEDLDHMQCDKELHIELDRSEQEKDSSGTETEGSDKRSSSPLLSSVRDFDRQVASITAERNARVRIPMLGEDGELEKRVLLTAERKLVYDAKDNNMDVSGPGDFTVEDMRPPQSDGSRKDQSDGESSQRTQRPSQTVFRWNDLMSFSLNEGKIELIGNVFMNHRSGRNVIGADQLAQKFAMVLPTGRATKLKCETLTACFPPPSDEGSSSERSRFDPRKGFDIGKLEKLTALRNVWVKDGVEEITEIRAQMILFDKTGSKDGAGPNIFHIFGSIPGQGPERPAIITRKVLGSGTSTPIRASMLLYDLDTGRIDIIKAFVTGGG